ncbi:very long chain fatty acid elongase AAEL008004-like isoform X1 [Dermacentor albipictus]|uniref:very long chain fatty acid elongase AAEL008004-like isoform X1 n=2 Tax=Dermacentor albipictus TaxID=60249 RepID=UPI0038FC3A22
MATASITADDGAPFFLRRDPRTAEWSFPGNKQVITLLLVGYIYVVKVAGPWFMKNRKPYDGIKPLIAFHNLFMVVASAYFVSAFAWTAYVRNGYSLLCQGIDFDARDDGTMHLLNLYWWYAMLRTLDFLDTLFFVLRKKDSHISFLHVVHHTIVVFNGWFGLTYGADGQAAIVVVINGSVHVVMYTYYFLSLLGPEVQKHLWWKRYITQLQLAQFVVLFTHALLPLFLNCGYPRSHTFITLSQAVFFFGLFTHFYVKNYQTKKVHLAAKHRANGKIQ